MADNPETLPDAEREDPEFTAAEWQQDLADFFAECDLYQPRQPDEFTIQDFMTQYKLGRWVAREFANRQVRQGVWAVRRLGNSKLYRIVKDDRTG